MGFNKYTIFPIQEKYAAMWNMYKKQVASFWTVEEVDLQQDVRDWEKLGDNEKHFIKNVLAFFAGSDGIVNENLDLRFSNEVDIPEARQFYAFQQAVEAIHSEMYGLLIDTLVKDEKEKNTLFRAIEEIPCVKRKADWALKWGRSEADFKQRLVAYACVEGIHFSGSFCAIYWIKSSMKLMPGLCFSNELISRDEGLHTDFAVELYHSLPGPKLDESIIHEMVIDALNIEKDFVSESLPVSLINMNAGLMIQYLEFVADRLLVTLGCRKQFNSPNPFEFMNHISMDVKTNFFEGRVAEYRRGGVGFENAEVIIDTENTDF